MVGVVNRIRSTRRAWRAFSAVVAAAATAATALAQPLQGKLDRLASESRVANCRIGVVVLDAADGRVLASRRADEQFIPASNMKLLTSGCALSVLGPDHTFETQLLFQPDPGSSGSGRLVVRGSGDPAFGDPVLLEAMGMSVDEFVGVWVKATTDARIRSITELVVDDRAFDRQAVHPTWPTGQLNNWYCAEVSGLTFHTNVIHLFARPAGNGATPVVSMEPRAPWITIRNRARTVTNGKPTVGADWVAPNAEITIRGDVRYASEPVRLAIRGPAEFFGRLLADRLAGAGLKPGAVRLPDESEDLYAGREQRVVHVVQTRMSTVLERCNVNSHNLYAECLLKAIGARVTGQPGSWGNGDAVMRRIMLERLGADAGAGIVVADGSGMSRENRVTPALLARWLHGFLQDDALSGAFLESLPSAGEEGTLEKRFRARRPRNEVRAKSGYISGVSALSGYVLSSSGERGAIFCIITNDRPNSVPLSSVRTFEENVVLMVDEWVASQATAGAR